MPLFFRTSIIESYLCIFVWEYLQSCLTLFEISTLYMYPPPPLPPCVCFQQQREHIEITRPDFCNLCFYCWQLTSPVYIWHKYFYKISIGVTPHWKCINTTEIFSVIITAVAQKRVRPGCHLKNRTGELPFSHQWANTHTPLCNAKPQRFYLLQILTGV